MVVILVIVGLILLACIAAGMYILIQGDAEFEFKTGERSSYVVEKCTADELLLSFKVPYVNKGSQDGTIMDAFSRHFLPQEQFAGVTVSTWLMGELTPRDDGYFEALIVPKHTGGTMVVKVDIRANNGDLAAAIQDMVDMPVDIYYQIVARSDWYIHKARIELAADDLQQLVKETCRQEA